MAVYAYDKYGNFLYGARDNTSPYYQSKINAELVEYNTVRISWEQVVPDPTDQNPTYWALVKTLTGMPDSPYEGKIVTGGAITQANTGTVVDTTNSVSYNTEWYETFTKDTNVEVNYSLWVYSPATGPALDQSSKWINCGDSNTVVVETTATVDTVSKWLPRAWQNSINGVGDAVGEYEFEDLLTVLHAYSLEYDSLRIKNNLLELSNTPRYITSSLARARQLDFGFDYESALGDPYYRSLTYSGDKVNSLKGTIQGLSEYIVALTHMDNKIEIGHNLFLDYNDSSFEESLGQWTAKKLTAAGSTTGTLISQVLYSATTHLAPQASSNAAIITDTSSDAGSIPRKLGAMKVVISSGTGALLAPTNSTFSLDAIQTTVLDVTTLIPVKAGLSYVFTGWAIGDPSTYSTVTPYIAWYDYTGKWIRDTTANSVAMGAPKVVTSAWQEFNSGSDMGVAGTTMGVKAPLHTAFALPMVKITGVGTTYLDMFQLAEHHYSIEYQDARQINVYLRGQEENLIPNPSFENYTTSGWFANNANLDVIAGGVLTGSSNSGTLALSITATSNASLVTTDTMTNVYGTSVPLYIGPEQQYTGPIVYSDWIPVDPSVSYTFTMHPNNPPSAPFTDFVGRIGIEYSSLPSEDKQNTITSYPGLNAYFYGSTTYLVTEQVTSAYYNDLVQEIYFTFTNGAPTNIQLGDYVSVKGLLSYPEMNVSGFPLLSKIDYVTSETIYYINLGYNLISTPDGSQDTSNAILCLMYYDTTTSQYEDLVSFANITEKYIDFSSHTAAPNTTPAAVTAVAPPYSKDAGMPYARVYLMPDLETGESCTVDGLRFSPTLLIDQYTQQSSYANLGAIAPTPIGATGIKPQGSSGDLVSSNNIRYTDYFDGDGNSTSALNGIDPLTVQYYDPRFCVWERKIWYNFISNPYFMMSDMGWTALANTTATYDSVNMLENITVVDNGLNGGIFTQVALPHPALGGEDVVVTMTIQGMVSGQSFSITSPDMSTPPYGNNTYYYNSNALIYQSHSVQKISAVFQAVTGAMTGTVQLNINTNGQGNANIQLLTASAEYGSTASASFMPTDTGAFTLANPMDPTMNLYASFRDSIGAGISSYIPNWPIKFNRLFATIKNYIPNGSTFRLTRGVPNRGITDLTESLIYSPSFEKDTGLWSGEQASLVRIPYAGRYLDLITHGIAYARVYANNLSKYEDYFGIISEPIPVEVLKSYYGSVAVRPVPGTNTQGFYSLKVDAYKINPSGADILLTTFNNRAEFNTTPIPPAGTAFTISSTAPSNPVAGDRWIDPNSSTLALEYTWTLNDNSTVGQWVENDESIYYTPGNEAAFTGYATFAATPPSSPHLGDRWYDTVNDIGYVWFSDDSVVYNWVELAVVYTQNDVYLDGSNSPMWAYINVLINKNDLQQVSYIVPGQSTPAVSDVDYVRIRVECSPDQYYVGQAFDVDRVVFRE